MPAVPPKQGAIDVLKNSHKALIVEDDFLIREYLAEQVRSIGFEVLESGSADEAIEILEAHTDIRLVFTDIQMPGSMDGVALSHFIRRRWPPTILIVSSGRQRPTVNELPNDAMFLSKPYDADELTQVIKRADSRLQSM